MLREAMETNDTLVHLDIENNPNMNIADVRAIQDKLMENRTIYYEERKREFKERRFMHGEKGLRNALQIEKETGINIKNN